MGPGESIHEVAKAVTIIRATVEYQTLSKLEVSPALVPFAAVAISLHLLSLLRHFFRDHI
jgi:hypothetical protein